MENAERLKNVARESGADLVAITHAEPFAAWEECRREAVRTGVLPEACVARMSSDPATFLPGAQSLIVFGVKYEGLADPDDKTSLRLGGGIRRRPACRQVGDALQECVRDLGGRAAVNSAIPYKRAAERSGLGWLGKNGLFTSPEYGSGIRLGTVITDLVLPREETSPQRGCGDCGECVESCPSGALGEDGSFDGGRCLCYLAEHDVPLPPAARALLDTRLNCEECQRACPYNKRLPSLGWPGPDMLDLAQEAEKDFSAVNDWFAEHFDFRLASRELLLRTLAVNLANAGRRDAIPLLKRLSAEEHRVLADCAGWALEKLRSR